MEKENPTQLFQELVDLVEKLRSEDGCPWDREQTRNSLKPLMLEELYEALEAIDREDEVSLKEELGDMLLHIIFHAQIGKERGTFTIEDVLTGIIEKMKQRHPHVFGKTQVTGVDQVLLNWENIKSKEKNRENRFSSIPRSLPALLRAFALQSRVARVGFDWSNAHEVWEKVEEELKELKEAMAEGQLDKVEREWGDLVFTPVNLARHLGVQPEESLRQTCDRFEERFTLMEKEIESKGQDLSGLSLEEMDVLWENAKKKKENPQ